MVTAVIVCMALFFMSSLIAVATENEYLARVSVGIMFIGVVCLTAKVIYLLNSGV